MKKTILLALALVLVCACFVACTPQQQPESPTAKYVLKDGTYVGYGQQVAFHGGDGPDANVIITVANNKITAIDFETVPTTDGFIVGGREGKWNKSGKTGEQQHTADYELQPEAQDFLNRIIALSLDEIMELKVNDPQNPSDHWDGGSIDGLSPMSGATATSCLVVRGVQAAIRKGVAQS